VWRVRWIGLVLLVVAGCLVMLAWSSRPAPSSAANAFRQEGATASAEAGPRLASAPAVPSASTAPDAASEVVRRGRAEAAARRLHHREAIEARYWDKTDPNYLALIRGLLPAARGGDTTAQLMIMLTLHTCERWAKPLHDGKTWREKLKDPRWQAGQWIRLDVEDVVSRCDPLAAASPEEVGTASDWYAKALAGGDGEVLIRQVEDGDSGLSPEERVKTFKHVLADADPAALVQIIAQTPEYQRAMGESAPEEVLNQALAVRDLALCQLGADCSSTGHSLKASCSIQDCRGIASLQGYYERRLTPQEFADAQRWAQYFADHFLAGGDGWPEAQAYEQALRQVAAGGG
jgi:hypothetical protein